MKKPTPYDIALWSVILFLSFQTVTIRSMADQNRDLMVDMVKLIRKIVDNNHKVATIITRDHK